MDANLSTAPNDASSNSRSQGYFFAEEVPFGMALMRMVLPPVLMIDLFYRHPWVRELYSTDGATAPLGVNFAIPSLLPEFGGGVAVALHAVLIAAMICSSIGWFTRISLVTATVLYSYFGLLDSLSTITKYTVIATHLLLLLAVSSSHKIWSVDAWLERRRNPGGPENAEMPKGPVWPAKLVQLLFGIIYLGAAITKMHTPSFFSGDQLMYWTMTYVNNVHPLGDWLSQYPLILSAFGYITIVWEIAFVFAIFHRGMKWWAIAIGAFFHIMTMFTLGLYIFPMVMFCGYLGYVMTSEWQVISNWRVAGFFSTLARSIPQWLERVVPAPRQRPWAAPAAYALTLGVVALAAVEVEYLRDPYKERGPNGPLALEEITPEEFDKLFEPDRPIRPSDKLLAFDLGTFQIGEHLSNRRREFKQGERIIAQATISPPHEDMWLDCWLHESKPGSEPNQMVPGRSVVKVGQSVARETFRANFLFKVDESLPPGEYFLRLRSGRDDLAIKKFTLLPRGEVRPEIEDDVPAQPEESLQAN